MPKVTVRPTKQQPLYKRIARVGSTGAAAAVADQSDATYIRRSVNGAPMARFLLAAPAIPADNDIATVVPGARLRQPTSNPRRRCSASARPRASSPPSARTSPPGSRSASTAARMPCVGPR